MALLDHFVEEQRPTYTRAGSIIPLPEHHHYVQLIKYLKRHNVQNNTRAALANIGNRAVEVKVRSVSEHPYDCVGMIFSNRRAWIGTDNIYDILKNDGYYRISESQLSVGDIAVYSAHDECTHIGMITQVQVVKGIRDIRVLSKWGFAGEFEHNLHTVPRNLGVASEYWTERTPYVSKRLL